jgi:hypothetical protein
VRLWRLHPTYLDTKGIVALWREGLLARAVLRGATKGYRHHPQLIRFREHPAPVSAINNYLWSILREAEARGFDFDRSKLGPVRNTQGLVVSSGQLEFERNHLREKLRSRDPASLSRVDKNRPPRPHPLFSVVAGPIAEWEKIEV